MSSFSDLVNKGHSMECAMNMQVTRRCDYSNCRHSINQPDIPNLPKLSILERMKRRKQ